MQPLKAEKKYLYSILNAFASRAYFQTLCMYGLPNDSEDQNRRKKV